MVDDMRTGLQAKYPFMANPYFIYILLGVVVVACAILLWKYRKNFKKRKV